MLITPTRSAHNPPSPAINNGIAKRKVAPDVPGEVMSVAPVMNSTSEMMKKRPAIAIVIRAGDVKNFLALLLFFSGVLVVITVIPFG
jgi:hypothetical protein